MSHSCYWIKKEWATNFFLCWISFFFSNSPGNAGTAWFQSTNVFKTRVHCCDLKHCSLAFYFSEALPCIYLTGRDSLPGGEFSDSESCTSAKLPVKSGSLLQVDPAPRWCALQVWSGLGDGVLWPRGGLFFTLRLPWHWILVPQLSIFILSPFTPTSGFLVLSSAKLTEPMSLLPPKWPWSLLLCSLK